MKLNRILSVFLASLLLFFYAGCSSYLLDLQNAMDDEGQETSSEVRSPTPVIIGPVSRADFPQVVASLTQDSTIVMTGQVTPSDLSIILTALYSANYLINLDLSNVTGLDSVPDWGLSNAMLSGITLPDSVTSIGDGAFSECYFLSSVYIPENVTSIGNSVFRNCGFTSINVPENVTSIGDSAFCNCDNLSSIIISENVTSIGDNAFSNCTSLTTVNITGSVTSIGDFAFFGCTSLTSFNIPESVTSIGEMAFFDCPQLAEINVDFENTNYSSLDGVLFNKNKTQLICYPIGKTGTSYSIPGSVTSIGDYAFSDCDNLSSIIISENVTSIGDNAFSNCTSLTSINIPEGATSIGCNAFNYCTSLTTVNITGSVTSIGDFAFFGCTSLTSINIPESVTSIGEMAFLDCLQLAEINVDLNNTNYSSLDGVLFNKNKTQLICYPKEKTGTSYSIPGSVTSIEDYAFSDCDNLSSIIIAENVTSIGRYTFVSCSNLTSVTFSDTSTWYTTRNVTNWTNKTGGDVVDFTNMPANFITVFFSNGNYCWYKL